ncbi:SDR family oxidoreductase [Allokutzneria oryzae]|uniref:SDR family oxidoreductase n=1 Tax=Allokutzneria oryzae TaxID=1378989 RepID=A0ABV5ZRM1_9PSEU
MKNRVLIIGGSSGMGLALAERLLSDGADVTVAGRSAERLSTVAARLPRVRTAQADISDEDAVRRLFTETGQLDHVVVTAADAVGAYKPVAAYDVATAKAIVGTKLLGPWLVGKHADLAPGGSITFTSGIAAYRPMPGSSVFAAVNGALEALVRALAVELAPLRVNAVSPGWIDTPIWDDLVGDGKAERLATMAQRLPVNRIGTVDDVSEAFVTLLRNGFITGTVVHVDGGHRLV